VLELKGKISHSSDFLYEICEKLSVFLYKVCEISGRIVLSIDPLCRSSGMECTCPHSCKKSEPSNQKKKIKLGSAIFSMIDRGCSGECNQLMESKKH